MARRVLRHELEAIRGNWGWILALGIILIVVGTIAVAMPFVSTLASAFAFGVLLLIGGIAQLVGVFWTRDWSGFFLSLLMGVLYLVLGVMFLRHPGEALIAMTLLLACALALSGRAHVVGHRHVHGFSGVSEVRVTSLDDRPLPLQVDGDYIGDEREAVFSCLPQGILVVS